MRRPFSMRSRPAATRDIPGFYVRVKLARAVSATVGREAGTSRLVAEARGQAERQEATGALRAIHLLEGLQGDAAAASSAVTALWSVEPGVVVALAEAILSRLGVLDDAAARRRPARPPPNSHDAGFAASEASPMMGPRGTAGPPAGSSTSSARSPTCGGCALSAAS